MKAKIFFIGSLAIFSLLCGAIAFSQEQVANTPQAGEDKTEDVSWVWGEVVKIDVDLGQITLKYLDYETDGEKETVLFVDPAATFENVPGLKDIKIGDYASVDYAANNEGKNIAKTISIEKPETPSGETAVPDKTLEPQAPSSETAVQEKTPGSENIPDVEAPALEKTPESQVPTNTTVE